MQWDYDWVVQSPCWKAIVWLPGHSQRWEVWWLNARITGNHCPLVKQVPHLTSVRPRKTVLLSIQFSSKENTLSDTSQCIHKLWMPELFFNWVKILLVCHCVFLRLLMQGLAMYCRTKPNSSIWLKEKYLRPWEMAHWPKALATLPETTILVPGTHTKWFMTTCRVCGVFQYF